MSTVALGGRTIKEIVETARQETNGSLVVAYGVIGASTDGWTTFHPDEDALRRYITHGRSRIAGKPGHHLVYGPHGLVFDYIYGLVDAERERRRLDRSF